MKVVASILALVLAACTAVPEPTPVEATAIARQLPGPWMVVGGSVSFFKADTVLFSADGRIRITRDGKLRRGSWAMVDGMLDVKGIEQTMRFEVIPGSDGITLRPLVERQGSWRRTDAEITLRSARVLPAKG